MVTVDLNRTINECRNAGVQLDVSGDKLIIRGNKMCPALRTLSALLAQDRRRVLAAVQNIEAAAKAEPPTPAPTSDLAFTLAGADDAPTDPRTLPSIRNLTGKPSLPANLWVTGLATFAEARQAQQRLSVGYGTALGKDGAGYFVRCPGWQWDPA